MEKHRNIYIETEIKEDRGTGTQSLTDTESQRIIETKRYTKK